MSDEFSGASDSDVAIVGSAARYPGARSSAELWRIFRDGVEAITEYDESELLAAGVDPADLRDPNYVRASGHLDGVEMFDAGFFGFGPKDAAITDPQHRHFMECCWEALEDAGQPPSRFDGSIGVFAGCGLNSYFIYNLLRNREVLRSTGSFLLRHTGNDRDFLPTTVSYKLDLTGPSVAVQTACSTSLVAIHMGCQSLISGECDMVLAGGVTVKVPHRHGYLYAENEPLDPTGHCRAFDARGAGTVLSSGSGVVVLRRLAEAIEDGDRIHAVIKGSAINNDGSRKIGYLAPSVDGQAAVVAEALAVADVDAESISYIATHGTGTHVGDPIEVSALTQAYRETTDREGFCFIGSSKPNIGHTDNAAGVASVIEVVEALRHRQIPPSINYERPNPNIDFERSPFRVNTELREWPGDGPRRGGVSSLGVGGTNAHVILEEAPRAEPSGPAKRSLQVLTVSAKNGRALDNTTAKLAEHFREAPGVDLADAAYTLDVGREPFEHRRVVVCESPADAALALEEMGPKRVFTSRAAAAPPEIDFMFPGAGAQYPNMGRELYEQEKVYRDAIDECLELAAPHIPVDLRSLMLPGDAVTEETRAELSKPGACLPAIFSTEVALARLWMSWGIEPRAMTGHSMGEYTAAHFAGVISLADALKVVCLRGVLVDGLEVRGRMLSVPLPESQVLELLGDGCELAASNGPSLCTVSGTVEEIEAFDAKLRERDIEGRQLRVPAAGHSRLLDPILPAFREGLASVTLSQPDKPYISNLSGDWVKPEEAASADYWVRHFRHTVRWSAGLETLLSEGSHLLLEVGPGQILGSLARQQVKKPVAALSSLRHPEDDVPDLRFVLTSFGRLWGHGADVSFAKLRGDERRNRIELPTYGFDHQPFWIEPDPPAVAVGAEAEELERTEAMAGWFFRPAWQPAPPSAPPEEGPLSWLVFADGTGVAAAMITRLEAQGHSVTTVREGDAFYKLGDAEYAVSPEAGLEGYVSLVRELAANDRLPDRIAHLWLVTGDDEMAWDGSNFFHYCEERGFYSLLHLAQALGAEDVTHPIHLGVVSNGRERVGEEPLQHPEKATAFGPIRVIPQEFRNVTCQAIDLPKFAPSGGWFQRTPPDLGAHAEWLATDIRPEAADRSMAYRGGDRFVQELVGVEPGALPEVGGRLRPDGCYLVTGGLGGLGLMLAEHLARSVRANLVLVSRTELPPRNEWAAWLESHGSTDPTSEQLQKLLEIEGLGSTVRIESGDVSNVVRMREVVAEARDRFGRLDGVFHAAGVIDDGPIQTKSQPEIEHVFTPKVHGTLVLDAIVRECQPDLFVLFSSNSAWLGPAGQVDYAGASAYLNALAESRSGAGATYTVAVDWGVWQGVGGAVDTYRRLSGADRSGPPVAHPLLDRRAASDGPGEVFATSLEVEPRWVLEEHRTLEGSALLPGTGYLEMVHGAFAEVEPGPSEIRGATFIAPLAVGDDDAIEVRLAFVPEGDERAFEVSSRAAGTDEWQLHAQGHVAAIEGERPAPLALAEIEDRCTRVEDAGTGAGLRTLHESQLRLGARWRSIRSMRFGEGEAVARLSLPEAFRRDLDEYALHPALLDMATGFGTPLIEGYEGDLLFAPMSYGRVRVYDRLPAEIVSHVRSAGENSVARETASFHVTLADLDGTVLVEIEDFTLRKIAANVRFGGDRSGVRAGGAAAGGGEHVLSEAERVFQRTYELGITPEEGLVALDRILSGGTLASVSVSPIHLPTLVERMRSLPDPGEAGAAQFARPELETDYVEPRDEVERTLVDIWRELLGVEQVGIQDDFFELGGHSLIAVRVFAKIKKAWDVEYPISLLFDAPNIERIAETVRADAGLEVGDAPAPRSLEPRFRCLVPLQKGEGADRPPFFLVAGMFGNVLNLRHIATHLGKDQPMWAIQAKGLLGDDPPHETFTDAARDYLEEVRQVQPEGPYYLGGFSGGGITAFEMARQLRAAGEEVGALVLLDSIPSEMPPLSLRDRVVVQVQRLRSQGIGYLARWFTNRIKWEIEKRQARADDGKSRDLSPAEFRSGQIEAAFRRSLARYETGVHDGPITLIRPPQDRLVPLGGGRFLLPSREIVDSENLWGKHTEAGVRVEVVPGDHDSMVLEPNVRVLAAKLQSCLDDAMLGKDEGSER